jgi:hypothetical protein
MELHHKEMKMVMSSIWIPLHTIINNIFGMQVSLRDRVFTGE